MAEDGMYGVGWTRADPPATGPEEDVVPPQPIEPCARVREEAVKNRLAGVDEHRAKGGEDPHHDGVTNRAGAEDADVGFGSGEIAVLSEVAAIKTEETRDEGV